jgi:hypothetical protein
MNKNIKNLLLIIIICFTTVTFSQSSHTGKGKVIAVRFLELDAEVDTAEFEKFAYEVFNPAHEGTIPGLTEYVAKSDRGNNQGSYALFMVFDSQIVRDIMIPDKSMSEWMSEIFEEKNMWTYWNKLGSYVKDGSLEKYNDYVVLK